MAEFCNEEVFDLELNDYEPELSNTAQDSFKLTAENVNPAKVKLGPEDFQLETVLGKGAYGKVYLVRKVSGHNCDRYFAMKVLKKASIATSEKNTAHTRSERNILETVKHPFIVDLVYAFQTDHKLYFVLEYLRGGALFAQLKREGIFFELSARFFACEIILALGHLHKLGVIYRDLKPQNILLDAEGHIKLTDFGLSKEHMQEGVVTHTLCGTLLYMAPEILTKRGHNKDVDWWSLGVLLYELLTGDLPFTGKCRECLVGSILKGKIEFPKYVEHGAQLLVRCLLKRQVNERLGSGSDDAVAVQSHPFFKNVNWDDVLARRLKPPFQPISSSESDFSQCNKKYTRQYSVESPTESKLSGDVHFEGFSYEAPSSLDEMSRPNRQSARSPR